MCCSNATDMSYYSDIFDGSRDCKLGCSTQCCWIGIENAGTVYVIEDEGGWGLLMLFGAIIAILCAYGIYDRKCKKEKSEGGEEEEKKESDE